MREERRRFANLDASMGGLYSRRRGAFPPTTRQMSQAIGRPAAAAGGSTPRPSGRPACPDSPGDGRRARRAGQQPRRPRRNQITPDGACAETRRAECTVGACAPFPPPPPPPRPPEPPCVPWPPSPPPPPLDGHRPRQTPAVHARSARRPRSQWHHCNHCTTPSALDADRQLTATAKAPYAPWMGLHSNCQKGTPPTSGGGLATKPAGGLPPPPLRPTWWVLPGGCAPPPLHFHARAVHVGRGLQGTAVGAMTTALTGGGVCAAAPAAVNWSAAAPRPPLRPRWHREPHARNPQTGGRWKPLAAATRACSADRQTAQRRRWFWA